MKEFYVLFSSANIKHLSDVQIFDNKDKADAFYDSKTSVDGGYIDNPYNQFKVTLNLKDETESEPTNARVPKRGSEPLRERVP